MKLMIAAIFGLLAYIAVNTVHNSQILSANSRTLVTLVEDMNDLQKKNYWQVTKSRSWSGNYWTSVYHGTRGND
jgi:hypothetical protein